MSDADDALIRALEARDEDAIRGLSGGDAEDLLRLITEGMPARRAVPAWRFARAVRKRDLDEIGALGGAGVDADAPVDGRPPVIAAFEAGDRALVAALLEAGAAADRPRDRESDDESDRNYAAAKDAAASEVLRLALREDDPATLRWLWAAGLSLRGARALAETAGQARCIAMLRAWEIWYSARSSKDIRALAEREADRFAEDRNRVRLAGLEEALEEALAEPLATAPPSGTAAKLRGPDHAMRTIAAALGPVDANAMERILARHATWRACSTYAGLLKSSSVRMPGSDTERLNTAVYAGPPRYRGAQAELNMRLLEAPLSGVDLSCANLVGVVARDADFHGADLSRALVTDALLRGADFRGARLRRVDFSRSDLRGARFDGADCTLVDFESCDLS